MRSKIKPDGQIVQSFIQTARQAQIIEQAIQTIADVGYEQASLALIAKKAGISKGVVIYYFTSKDELLRQVVNEIFTAAVKSISAQVDHQPTAAQRLQAYIRSAVEYIGAHRARMTALIEILDHHQGDQAQPLFQPGLQEEILSNLEGLLRNGQAEGSFRPFDPGMMAVVIRRAIDAVPSLYAANPNLDIHVCADELVTLFDRATRTD